MKSQATIYSSFRDIHWKTIIPNADKTLDIVVYYWDTWTAQNLPELKEFLAKPDTCIRFYFTDLNNPILAKQILELFPRNKSIDDLKQRISATYKPLQDFFKDTNLSPEKVMVYKIPRMLGYALQKIDDSTAILAPFEMYRSLQHVDAPAFMVDLQKNQSVKLFCEKELIAMRQAQ
jgi:hypothetical protein